MKITLRQLEIFAAIANHGHVTRAAEAVAMTQSAASTALAVGSPPAPAPLLAPHLPGASGGLRGQ